MAKILILGGNRFFGKRLAKSLVSEGHQVTLANRSTLDDGLQNQVSRIRFNRDSADSMKEAFRGQTYDLIFDQIAYFDFHAQSAIEVFSGKVGRYLATSTMSVYPPELSQEIDETQFDPFHFDLAANPPIEENGTNRGLAYMRGKQRMEATFFQNASFPLVATRLSFVLGADDYTQRLNFHVDHVRDQKPIYFPNPSARICMIDSQDAAEALIHLAFSEETGPFNVCARKPIALNRMMQMIETKLGKKTLYAENSSQGDSSPYGVDHDRFLNTTKLEQTGYGARPIESWLSDIII
jgi:nucleoside-diphosphate-sugar epimerase